MRGLLNFFSEVLYQKEKLEDDDITANWDSIVVSAKPSMPLQGHHYCRIVLDFWPGGQRLGNN